ncbi:Hypothetical predicted protein [Olea europaea subsp. europaea]|uniref:Uncharacterized protein n=1 Tax=Olea europaea subsp. europaea TaxID=158383 RepID=A0A8S0UPG5_OLEEU|nr:Hypothetical predicted protein [Olea europaea subsp. europaea]
MSVTQAPAMTTNEMHHRRRATANGDSYDDVELIPTFCPQEENLRRSCVTVGLERHLIVLWLAQVEARQLLLAAKTLSGVGNIVCSRAQEQRYQLVVALYSADSGGDIATMIMRWLLVEVEVEVEVEVPKVMIDLRWRRWLLLVLVLVLVVMRCQWSLSSGECGDTGGFEEMVVICGNGV